MGEVTDDDGDSGVRQYIRGGSIGCEVSGDWIGFRWLRRNKCAGI